MKQFPCRCTKCRARQTLAKEPHKYLRERRCFCGGQLRVDWYRRSREHKRNKCHCLGYPFPHRKGGGVWCNQHPTGPTEQDMIDRYGPNAV